MKKLSIATATLLAFATPAAAEHIQATLIGYEEVPSVSTVAAGSFSGMISPDEQFIDYELSFGGLQGSVTQAHIHVAQRGVNGSIVIWLCGTAALPGPMGTPTCPDAGVVGRTITAADVIAGAMASQQLPAGGLAQAIAAMRAGVAYVNVHTSLSTGGEIRGQIRASSKR